MLICSAAGSGLSDFDLMMERKKVKAAATLFFFFSCLPVWQGSKRTLFDAACDLLKLFVGSVVFF